MDEIMAGIRGWEQSQLRRLAHCEQDSEGVDKQAVHVQHKLLVTIREKE